MSSQNNILRSVDGTRIFAEATGNPANAHLVLVHGIGLSGAVFDRFCADDRLKGLYIVRYDLRGQGRSDRPLDEAAYSSERFAEDFQAVVDAFKLQKPVVAGWSYGGTLSADIIAHLPPNTISGFLFISAIPYAGPILEVFGSKTVMSAIEGMSSLETITCRAATNRFVETLFNRPADAPYSVNRMYAGHSTAAEIWGFLCTRKQDESSIWEAGKAGFPVFLLFGTADQQVIGENVYNFMRPRCTNLSVCKIEGGSHALHEEYPDQTIKAILEFVDKVAGKVSRTSITPRGG
ncbi:alpha/beta-hydrolase [Gloeopeniophorella convolvens]|nr:alpha/beta-hydrolase [Gloeopeniophorella convolvens]